MICFTIKLAGPIILIEPLNDESGNFAVEAFGGQYNPTQSSVWIKNMGELEALEKYFNAHEVQYKVVEK